jgi:hypothetical protein
MKIKFIKIKDRIVRSDQILRISHYDAQLTFYCAGERGYFQTFYDSKKEAKEELDRIYKELQASCI